MSFIGKLGGKKFLTAIGTVIATILTNLLGLPEEVAQMIVATGLTYIVTQGVTDSVTGGITSSSTPTVDLEAMKRIQLATELEKTKRAQIEADAKKEEARRLAEAVGNA